MKFLVPCFGINAVTWHFLMPGNIVKLLMDGFPKKLGIEIAVDAFTGFLEEHEMEIFLVVFGEKSVKISGELGEEVSSFIDNDYVEAALDEEYSHDGIPEADSNILHSSVALKCLKIPDFLQRKEENRKEEKKDKRRNVGRQERRLWFRRFSSMMNVKCFMTEFLLIRWKR